MSYTIKDLFTEIGSKPYLPKQITKDKLEKIWAQIQILIEETLLKKKVR